MDKKIFINKSLVNIDFEKLEKNGISRKSLSEFFPDYILVPKILKYGRIKRFIILVVKKTLALMVWVILRPRISKVGALDLREVDKVYKKEAKSYNLKHHITTRGMDLIWRRANGWFLATNYVRSKEKIRILDLCTGTGLSAKEVANILNSHNIKADLIALDYSESMLSVARSSVKQDNGGVKIEYMRGDATVLVAEKGEAVSGLATFDFNTFDAVIQMFGIGGIDKPIKSFVETLKVLKEGGYFLMTDMHRPIPEFFGESPILFFRWLKMPLLEAVLYEETTIPLVLNRLWGWRDTTLLFYLIRLVVYRDEGNRYWGFECLYFDYEPQRWWFSLPFMPVAKIITKKIQISEMEFKKRKLILESFKMN